MDSIQIWMQHKKKRIQDFEQGKSKWIKTDYFTQHLCVFRIFLLLLDYHAVSLATCKQYSTEIKWKLSFLCGATFVA